MLVANIVLYDPYSTLGSEEKCSGMVNVTVL